MSIPTHVGEQTLAEHNDTMLAIGQLAALKAIVSRIRKCGIRQTILETAQGLQQDDENAAWVLDNIDDLMEADA